jgi:hypothetical protein
VLDVVERIDHPRDGQARVVVEVEPLVQVGGRAEHHEAVDDERVVEVEEEGDLDVEAHRHQIEPLRCEPARLVVRNQAAQEREHGWWHTLYEDTQRVREREREGEREREKREKERESERVRE